MDTPSIYEGDFARMRVGLCQILTKPWQIEDNLKRTLKAVEEAAAKGADIAVTPECVLNGYPMDVSDDFNERVRESAEAIDGTRLKLICRKASECGLHVLIGFAELGKNGEAYNSAALISPKGKIIDVYRKVHCRSFESTEHNRFFTPGDGFSMNEIAVDGNKFKTGTMICFDREIPESVRSLRALGSEIIFCPLATNTSNLTEYSDRVDNEMVTRCRAAENEVFIVVVNHAERFNGGSFVVGPSGEILLQMGQDPEVQVLEIPVGAVTEKFHNDPLGWMGWGYRRQSVYNACIK